VLVGAEEPMGWGTRPEHVERFMPRRSRLEYFEQFGHFVHIEQPELVSTLILDFLSESL
jgi:pimeloyl-ACP methyl ester carboxylesterase